MKMSPIEAATIEIADLKYQVECLQRELGQRPETDRIAKWREAFGFSGFEAVTFDLLYRRRGQVVSKEAIMLAIYQGSDEPDDAKNCICQFIHRLRRRRGLPPGSINTVWGAGYTLSQTGTAAALRAVADASQAAV